MLFGSLLVFPTSHTFIVFGAVNHQHLKRCVWHVGSRTKNALVITRPNTPFQFCLQSDTKLKFHGFCTSSSRQKWMQMWKRLLNVRLMRRFRLHLWNWSVGIWWLHIYSCNWEGRTAVKWFFFLSSYHHWTSLTELLLWVHFSLFLLLFSERNRRGVCQHPMSTRRMVALYDYDPRESSPNIDVEVLACGSCCPQASL